MTLEYIWLRFKCGVPWSPPHVFLLCSLTLLCEGFSWPSYSCNWLVSFLKVFPSAEQMFKQRKIFSKTRRWLSRCSKRGKKNGGTNKKNFGKSIIDYIDQLSLNITTDYAADEQKVTEHLLLGKRDKLKRGIHFFDSRSRLRGAQVGLAVPLRFARVPVGT